MRRAWMGGCLVLALGGSAHAETVALQVQDAKVVEDPASSQAIVEVTLEAASGRRLAAFTHQRVGRKIQLRVDGVLLTSPIVQGEIAAGRLQLTPGQTGFGDIPAQDIVRRLNGGHALVVSDER